MKPLVLSLIIFCSFAAGFVTSYILIRIKIDHMMQTMDEELQYVVNAEARKALRATRVWFGKAFGLWD
jgi:hypothetical protein